MAKKFVADITQRFRSVADNRTYVLIFGDEVDTLAAAAPSGPEFRSVKYRNRVGEWKEPPLTDERTLEMYFLDVGQGDAAFVVTPNDTKILVDGGLQRRALGFLIWKYRLDVPENRVRIDHLFVSHADTDHIEGLIPLLKHPQIDVANVYHNGIGVFRSGFAEKLGNLSADEKRLVTLHNKLADLDGLDLARTFGEWIDAVKAEGSNYRALSDADGVLDIGDETITLEILGPRLETDGKSLLWFNDPAPTINGHSLVFRLAYRNVRAFFSGDLNPQGSAHLLSSAGVIPKLRSHVFKAPHHGSHEYSQALLNAVNPMVSVISSGSSPDHGHPRAVFLGALGLAGRGEAPLVFATELAATFADVGEAPAPDSGTPVTFDDLDFSTSAANPEARRRFKKMLSGVITLRTDGRKIYAFRRVQAGYQWESYRVEPLN
jgi:beta-lactamase superfamily II metal-dependent hydrolase